MNLSYEAGVTVLRSVSIIIFFVIKTTKQVCLYFVDKKNKWYEIPYVTFTVLDKLWHGYNPNTTLPVLALPTNWYGYNLQTKHSNFAYVLASPGTSSSEDPKFGKVQVGQTSKYLSRAQHTREQIYQRKHKFQILTKKFFSLRRETAVKISLSE